MNEPLREFVESSFQSVWSLETLLLLYRMQESWSAEQLVNEFRSSELVVAQSIDALLASGLVILESDGAVRYRPASAEQDELVRQLEDIYRKKPTAIRKLIVQNQVDQSKTFADAFKFRKT